MTQANYFKLGIFVMVGLALGVVAVIYFGSSLLGRSAIVYQVFFDESVEGLDVGSLVRLRGVTLGQVSAIGMAPDHRHVRVSCSLGRTQLRREGLAGDARPDFTALEREGLRAQMALVGVTGQRIILLDYFDPATHPVEPLPFPTPERTLPATTSTLTTVVGSLEVAAAELPKLIDTADRVATEGRAAVEQLGASQLGAGAARTLTRANDLLATLQGIADQFEASRTPQNAARVVADLDASLVELKGVLDRLNGEQGLLSTAQRTTAAVGDVARRSGNAALDLQQTLRQAYDAFAAVRRLADAIERDPEMLLKGRAGRGP